MLRVNKIILALVGFLALTQPAFAAGEVNVYSYRQPNLITPLLKAFTDKTGIKVNIIYAGKGLVERMAQEGKHSPADVLLTADIGNLVEAEKLGVTDSLKDNVINANIPAEFRQTNGHWFALTTRARIIYASNERVKQNTITYEELADPKWHGKICIRSGQHPYNTALIASMILHHGEDETRKWLQGVKANLARKPAGNDRSQVKGVYSGQCDIALGNSYYMAKMQTNDKEPEQKEWAKSVRILFPNTNDRGSHINISGMALAKYAPHRKNAHILMTFLASDPAQKLYADSNNEYPINPGVKWSERVKSWGKFKPDTAALGKIADLRKRASELVDEVAFDEGAGS